MKMRETSRARDKKPWDKNNSTWHNQIVILKQQFLQLATVIGSALIQALKPFVMRMNSALSGLIKFAQNVVNALGKIFGWEMEVNTKGLQLDDEDLDYDADALEGVADAADDVADANNNAAKATKKLNDQLQGFDKLNVLRTTEKTPSTSTSKKNNNGKGDDGTNGNGLVSGGDVDSILKKTKSKFKSDIDSLEELGKYIGDALKKALDGIKWDDIYKKASNFGKGLANFLNGLISPELFYELGETVAKSINTAFHFLNSFGKTFKWDNFGKSMAFGLNGFMRNLDWGLYMDTAKTWAQGIADTLNNFVKYTNWQTLGSTIAKAIKTAVLFFLTLGSKINWKELGKALGRTINGAIKDFPAKEIANTIDAWVQGIYDMLVEGFKTLEWDKLKDKIKEFFGNLDWKTVKILVGGFLLMKGAGFVLSIAPALAASFLKELPKKLFGAVVGGLPKLSISSLLLELKNIAWMLPGTPAFDVIVTDILEKIGDAFSKMFPKATKIYLEVDKFIKDMMDHAKDAVVRNFKSAFNSELWNQGVKDFKQGGISMILGLVEGLGAIADFLLAPITQIRDFIVGKLCELFGIHSPAEVMIPIGKNIIEGILEGFKLPDFDTALQFVVDKIIELGPKISESIGSIKGIVEGKWEEIKAGFGAFWENVTLSSDTGWETIKSKASGAWESLKTGASEGVQTLSAKWDELKTSTGSLGTSLSEKWEDMKTKFAGLKDSIVKHAGTIVTQGGQKFTEFKNAVGERVGKLKSDAEKKFDELKTSLPQKISDLASKFKSPLEAIAKAFENGFKNAGTKAINKVAEMYNSIVKKINDMIKEVKKILPMALGNLFKFKLPTFEFETKTLSLANLSITYPSGVKASWHKKAYQNPMMFTQPTLMPSMNGLKGFGDGNGGEIVYGHKNLMNDIREASGNSDMTAIGNRQLANDQRIISLLQIIAEKEFGITGDSVFRTVRDQASNYTSRTGRQAFEF